MKDNKLENPKLLYLRWESSKHKLNNFHRFLIIVAVILFATTIMSILFHS